MQHKPASTLHHFFTTPPMPCPYFSDRKERRLMTELCGRDAGRLHDVLSLNGFRRSHNIAYTPTCPTCHACLPIRVDVGQFCPGRTQRRVHKLNDGLHWQECKAIATTEQYDLFSRYQAVRHTAGEMSKMGFDDYRALVEDSPIETRLIEFRDSRETLMAVCLMDVICDGLSAVYSFFDPLQQKKSLGTYMILWLIRHSRSLDLSYVYLGFWIEESPKMAYKVNFKPYEVFTNGKWTPVLL